MVAKTTEFKVLIADDSAVYRKLLETTLSPQGYLTYFAKSGRETIELVAEHQPDIIITNWMMPDIAGLDLCRHLREDFKHSYAYIIILTGVSGKQEISAGLAGGADDYLTKPFAPEELKARIRVGCRVIEFHRQLHEKTRLLESLALTDALTALPNRRAIEAWAHIEFARAVRHGFPLCVVMADLDRFKQLNDTFGHDAGDAILKRVAKILKDNCRSSNMCARVGGEEFLTVLTHTGLPGGLVAIEKIQERLAEQVFTFGSASVVVTASFGIASLEQEPESFVQLVERADAALYEAKRSGRNRISVAPRPVKVSREVIHQFS
jgi:two-component system, cell cycle response regulator